MPFYLWSKTSASNASADPTINFQEGQPPPSYNDSARALMAATAQWRDDVSGTITTAGTSTAYTLSSNQVFTSLALMNGAMIAFVPHTTCTGASTLAVDSLTAKPLRLAPGVDLSAGTIIQGTPYVASYNNSDGAFYLHGFYSIPTTIPVGGFMPYIINAVPNSNFAFAAGQNISRTTYSGLFSMISTTFGAGDGLTTFGLPDLRGRAIFGLDNMGGLGTIGRISVPGLNFDGTVLGNTGGAQNHTLTTTEMPSHTHGITDLGHSHTLAAGGTTNTGGLQGTGSGTIQGNPGTSTVGTGITINNAGSGGAHTIMPPAMTLPILLRVI